MGGSGFAGIQAHLPASATPRLCPHTFGPGCALYPGLWGLAWDDAKRTRRLGTRAHPPTVRVTTAVTNRLPHGYSALGEQGRTGELFMALTGELFMALTPALSVQTLLCLRSPGVLFCGHTPG